MESKLVLNKALKECTYRSLSYSGVNSHPHVNAGKRLPEFFCI